MPTLKWLLGDDATILEETNFQLLVTAAILPVLGTSLLSPVLDSLIGPFGTSASNVGLLISMFTAPAIVMIPVIGLFADCYGRKPVLVTSITLYGLAGTAIAFTGDFRIALALRFIQGIGFGGINPTIITSIGDIYDGTREATGQGLRFTVAGLSGTLFPLVAGALVTVAWQYPFFIYALALPIAAMVYHWFDEPDSTGGPTAKNQDSGKTDGNYDVGTAQTGGRPLYGHKLYEFVRRRRILAIIFARSFPVAVWIAFITYNSIIVIRLIGGTPLQAGLLVAIGSAIMATTASQTGRITDIFDSRFRPLAGASLCLTAGFGIILIAPGIAVATAGTVVLGAGIGVILSLYRSVITMMTPPTLRAGVVGISESGGQVAATLAPVVMSLVITLTTPAVGFTRAVQIAGFLIAVVGGVGSLAFLAVARAAQPPPSSGANVPEN